MLMSVCALEERELLLLFKKKKKNPVPSVHVEGLF